MIWPIVIASAVGLLTAVSGALLTKIGPWYYGLRKPSWQPPDWLFGPAWTLIFALAVLSATLAWYRAPDAAARTVMVLLFAANSVLNIAWSWLFFTRQRPDWALGEVVFLWLSILALIVALWPYSPGAAWLLVPYLLWVSFASFLNWTIVRLNAPFRTA
ncbi:MAG: tryptophan-rich sensory protein [Acetobacteraceae bacterium]|nr:tryptophan-rich sensory protein [Acetobacteraceae bacterium]